MQSALASLRTKGLSGTTVQMAHGVLHTALRDAARWGLVARNVSDLKAISEMLGHSDVTTTTLRIYAHVVPTTQEQAANAMDRLLTRVEDARG